MALGCSSASTNTNTDAGDAGGGGAVAGGEYCTTDPQPRCTGIDRATCGVCVTPPAPPTPLERTRCDDTSRREYCREGAPGPAALGCYATRPTAGMSRPVTMWGNVRVFGNGGDSQHIRVTVYRVGADGMPGAMVGAAVTDVMGVGNGTEDVLDTQGQVMQTRRLGGYQIPNVPTETELIVVTEGDAADSTAQALWSHRIYDYNVMLRNDEIGRPAAPMGITGDAVNFRPRVISNGDWTAIPSAATLVTGIPTGHGAVAGEVHDCEDIRLTNAAVYSNPPPNFVNAVYFSDNDTNPLPDLSRQQRGTSLLGTYALLDANPGPVTVSALGYDAERRLVHLGSYRARVWPDAVTIVTFRGRRPWQ